MALKATNEQIIAAYKDTGSVWAAAKRLGMVGQSVWERLRILDYAMPKMKWTTEEVAELRRLAGRCTLGEIASRLGRPYMGIACKISELQLGSRYGNRQQRKRRRGYPAAKIRKLMIALEVYEGSTKQFCREHSIDLEYFIGRIQALDMPFWDNYTRRRSDLTPKICPYCRTTYYPLTKKQKSCSRRCGTQQRTDLAYFGGRRRETIGLAEGVCQLCMEKKDKLSSHHMLGKQNDPDNEFLIALCAGCHHLVGMLSSRKFAEDPQGWENLINLVLGRRLADKNQRDETKFIGSHTCVDIEWLTPEDFEMYEAVS